MTSHLADLVQHAALAGDAAALAQLVAAHGAAAVRHDGDPAQLTALHWAAASGDVNAVRFLLAPPVEADPRAARVNNFTPLHSAAMQGHADVCAELIAAGADVNHQTDPQRYAPLHSAAFAGHVAALRVLLAHGADRELVNYRQERPADTARRTGQTEAAKLLEG